MNNSVSCRMNGYGIMRAVAMSYKQLKHLVFAEASTYAFCGCVLGIILGLPCHRLIFRKMITFKWGLEWQVPFSELLFIIAVVIATTLLSVINPVRKISNIDVVKLVNEQ